MIKGNNHDAAAVYHMVSSANDCLYIEQGIFADKNWLVDEKQSRNVTKVRDSTCVLIKLLLTNFNELMVCSQTGNYRQNVVLHITLQLNQTMQIHVYLLLKILEKRNSLETS